MASHGGESRNAHFADAASRISESLATGAGVSDGTDGMAGMTHQAMNRPSMYSAREQAADRRNNSPAAQAYRTKSKPVNGMMEEHPDIPRFGADEIDYGY